MNRHEAGLTSHARLLTAMGNERRLSILLWLLKGEISVGVLSKNVGLSQSALSQHLARLRVQGLVSTRREGPVIYYSSTNESVKRIIETLAELPPICKKHCSPEKNASHPTPDETPSSPIMDVVDLHEELVLTSCSH